MMLWDVFNMYRAMLLYYILQSPYPLMIWLLVSMWYIPWGFLLCVLPSGLGFFIRFMQWCLYQATRIVPAVQEPCSKVDSALNTWGLWLENSGSLNSETDTTGKSKEAKRIPVFKIWVLLTLGALVFVIIPNYLESKLTGNSQQICMKINQFAGKKVAGVQEFVNQYYVPKVQEENAVEEPEEETEERIVLHLGEEGVSGSNLRSSPEVTSDNIIDVVDGDTELVFENEIQESEGTIWVKVSTDEVSEAWISRKVLNEDEVALLL